jgi:hypothetical protein
MRKFFFKMRRQGTFILAANYLLKLILITHLCYTCREIYKRSVFIASLKDKGTAVILHNGFDWIEWEEKENGVFVKKIYSPVVRNNIIGDDYLEPGDKLISVENTNIPDLFTYQQIMLATPPTLLLNCRILKNNSQYRIKQYYILYGYKPFLAGTGSSLGYRLYFYFSAFLSIISIILLGLAWPFLKANFNKNYFLFFWLGLVGIFFLFQCIRFTVIENDPQFRNYSFNEYATIFTILFWVCIAMGIVLGEIQTQRPKKIIHVMMAIVGSALLLFISYLAFQYHKFDFSGSELFLYQVYFCAKLYWLIELYKKKYIATFYFIIVATATSILLTIASCKVLHLLPELFENQHLKSIIEIIVIATFIFPLTILSRNIIRYGNIRLVISKSLLYLSLILITFLSYLIYHEILKKIIVNELWRGLIELSCIILTLSLFRYLYTLYQPFLQKYIKIGSKIKEEQLYDFINSLNKVAHSNELLEKAQIAVSKIFNVSFFYVLSATEKNTPYLQKYGIKEQWLQIADLLSENQTFWSANKEFHAFSFPENLENSLLTNKVSFIFRLNILGQVHTCFIGSPKKGEFTFSELYLFQRLVEQIALRLEILYLIEKEKTLREKNAEAQLIALRAQINPHFLFNTFNSITELIHIAPQKAEEALEKLAFIIRYTLKVSNQTFVPLADEMLLVQTYLAIEQIRFGEDRLVYQIQWPQDLGKIPVPALVIQTVVENCIKHGISKITKQGVVTISGLLVNNALVLEIYDNGPGIDLERIDKGTGLKNIIERMSKIYNQQDKIEFEKKAEGTLVRLKFEIPREHLRH